MLNGYVGIVSKRGLCHIQVERRETVLRVHRATAINRNCPRIVFWAILPDDTAHYISSLVEQDEGREALRILNQVAKDGGHLLPLHQ